MPIPNESVVRDLNNYDPNLFVQWDVDRELWAIKRKDNLGQVHHIFFVQEPDGTYRPLDNRVIQDIYECDIWKHFKDASDYHEFIQDKNRKNTLKLENLRNEYIKWWNKEHKKEWKEAIDNAQRGIF